MLNKGDQIGQFILLNKVGSGGFGDVWKAEKRTALDINHFALKFFRPKDDRLDFDKIGKELSVWKQLKGLPHIISVIELDRFDDYVYVVSDFADGGSLENWLKDNGDKASSQAEAVKITLEILRGLENLHDKGFVHRDLKPDNILIMNGRHCLADFGVSREIKTHSKATGTAGTMEYMPPEAFEKNPPITPQTDIWAVGVILQRLLTGELPYPQEDYPSLVSAILMYEPEKMPESIPLGLREIVKKALRKNRENRFQTAREMIEALKNPQEFLAGFEPKTSETFTVIDEDFDKTEQIVIEPIKDWRQIETENAEELADSNNLQILTNSVGMEFVKIPAGSFMMGSDRKDDEKPIHKVTVNYEFYMGKYEVTQEQYESVTGSNPSSFKNCPKCPVESVSWEDAQEFIRKLNAKNDGYKYRLPTEAEWEYAARAGTTGDFYGNLDSIAWYDGNSDGKTHPVGQKQANAFGLYDMSGNVWEWCQDWYSDYPSGAVTNPTGATSGSYRVLRGGGWFYVAVFLRSAIRFGYPPWERSYDLGFRVVRQ